MRNSRFGCRRAVQDHPGTSPVKKYSQYIVTRFLAMLCGMAGLLTDGGADEAGTKRELLNLKHKIERLEKSRRAEEIVAPDRVTFSGLVEVGAWYADGPRGVDKDITLSTVELGMEAQVSPWVNAHGLLLFEEDVTEPMEVDEAIITLANTEVSPWSLAAGRMYVPFGHYESALISDPLTLEIGETRETALQFGYEGDGFLVLAWVANGETRRRGGKGIGPYGVQIGAVHGGGASGVRYSAGLSWTRNIADSNRLQEAVFDKDALTRDVPGVGGYAVVGKGPSTFVGEYVAALRPFDIADLDFGGRTAQPAAINLEFDYGRRIGGREAQFAIAWQQTREALALELPEMRLLAAVSVGIYKNTTLALEYAHEEDYETDDGGSGGRTDILTLQLALEF